MPRPIALLSILFLLSSPGVSRAREPQLAVARVNAPAHLHDAAAAVREGLDAALRDRGIVHHAEPALDLDGLMLAVGCELPQRECMEAVLERLEVEGIVGVTLEAEVEGTLVLTVQRFPPAEPGREMATMLLDPPVTPAAARAAAVSLTNELFAPPQPTPEPAATPPEPERGPPAAIEPPAPLQQRVPARPRDRVSAPGSFPLVPVVLITAGGGLLVGGAVALALASRDRSTYEAYDVRTTADARDATELREDAQTKGTLGVALLSASALSVGTGIVLLALEDDDGSSVAVGESALRLRPWMTSSRLGIRAEGRF